MSSLLKSYLAEKLVLIPGGTVIMRNFSDEQKWISSNSKISIPGRKNNLKETSQEIEVKPFQLLSIPVTNDLYDFVVGESKVFSNNCSPVIDVSWNDAINFCNLLSEIMGLTSCYIADIHTGEVHCDWEKDGFRLPAEAEWQHACFVGSREYQYGKLEDIAWYQENSNGRIHNVGEKTPNQWGVYDMLGNVWEWCWDLYDEKHYGAYRTFRGGSWAEPSRSCGATARRRSHPSFKIDDLGFRIAKSI